jgi:diguanylate cyclase (GGDEF)-like protein
MPQLIQKRTAVMPAQHECQTVLRAITDMTQVRSTDMMRQRFAENLTQIFPIAGIRFLTLSSNGRLDEPLSCKINHSNRAAELVWNHTPRRGIMPQGALARCVSERRHVYPQDTQHVDYFAIGDTQKLIEIIEVRQLTQTHAERGVLSHVIGIYSNFLRLLQEQEIDCLTKVLNRGAFDNQLNITAQSLRNQRLPHPAAPQWWLLMLDVDHFKQVNDNFGHLIGDEVLLLLAGLMRKSFRGVDRIYRYGGEEFAVLISPCTRSNALCLAERFRHTVESTHFPQVQNVTISAGLAPVDRYDHISNIIGRADKALYQAKRNGRNAVCEFLDCAYSAIRPDLQMTGTLELFS